MDGADLNITVCSVFSVVCTPIHHHAGAVDHRHAEGLCPMDRKYVLILLILYFMCVYIYNFNRPQNPIYENIYKF